MYINVMYHIQVQESPRNGNGNGSGSGSADDAVPITAQGPFTLPSFSFDTPTLSLWSQFNDKIQATKEEVVVWMALQDQFLASVTDLSISVQRVTSDAIGQYKNKNKNRNRNEITSSMGNIHQNATDEILQGLQMFSRQSKEKLKKCEQALYESRKNVANFAVLGNDIQVTIEEYEKVLSCYMQEEGSTEWKLCGEESSGGEKGSEDRIFEMGSLLDKLKQTSQILHESSTRDTHDDMACRSRSPLLVKAQSPMQSPLQTPRSSREVITTEILFDYDVQCTHGRLMVKEKNSDSYHQLLTTRDDNNNYNNNNNNHNNDYKSKCRSDIMVDGSSFWTFNKTDLTNTTEIQPSPYIQINLKECVILTSVIIQGGLMVTPIRPNQSSPSHITLQCGINLSNCDGDVALTSSALGEVINWTALLRKTGPEKFLQRPPIRFLFDLFVHCGWEFPNLFPSEVRDADWDKVGESKQAKLEYMDVMILFLSEYLNVSSPTCAASIVSGSNSDLTNILLQHLAIAIYWYKGTTSFPTSTTSSPRHIKGKGELKLESSAATASHHNNGRNTEAMVDCWPTEIGISTSFDGLTWRHNNPANHYKAHITSLTNSDNKVEILLEESEIAVQHIRIFPFKWSSSLGDSNILFKDDIKSALAVRASVRAQCIRTTKNLNMSVDDAAHSPSNLSCGADGVKAGGAYWSGDSVPSPRGTLSVLEALHEVTVVVIAALTYLNGAEQLRKLRKQEEIRKVSYITSPNILSRHLYLT